MNSFYRHQLVNVRWLWYLYDGGLVKMHCVEQYEVREEMGDNRGMCMIEGEMR